RVRYGNVPAPLFQAGACALEGAGDCGDRVVEHLGGLLRRAAEHVAQDEYGPLFRWQKLDRGEECEFDGLAIDEVVESPVGKRLQMFKVLDHLDRPHACTRARAETAS